MGWHQLSAAISLGPDLLQRKISLPHPGEISLTLSFVTEKSLHLERNSKSPCLSELLVLGATNTIPQHPSPSQGPETQEDPPAAVPTNNSDPCPPSAALTPRGEPEGSRVSECGQEPPDWGLCWTVVLAPWRRGGQESERGQDFPGLEGHSEQQHVSILWPS